MSSHLSSSLPYKNHLVPAGFHSPSPSIRHFSRQIMCRQMSCSSQTPFPTLKTVTISYTDLKDKRADLSLKIEEGFGPNGLGILSITDVPGFHSLRRNLLRLSPRLASLPEEVKKELEDPHSRDKELRISLWDENAETITENDFKEDEGPYIIIVTSTTVKAFQGKLNLNTTSASKVYVNIDITEVSQLIDRYKVVEDEYNNIVRSIPARDKKPRSESELILQTTMSLAEIKALEWVEGVKERYFTCYADIVKIETEFGWNYISCQLCKRKVKQQDNMFWCNTCNSESQFPMPSYKVQIQVKDHTGTASFVLFDKDAEKIIQKTAMELSSKSQEPNKVPQEIQNLLGKSYTFQIKVDDYNVKQGWEVYTVTSVFKSESNKPSNNVVADNIQIKPLETLSSHDQTIANDPIATSDIKLLTSLKDVADDSLIDDVFGNTQLKDLRKKRTSEQTSSNNPGSSQNKKKK